MRNARAVYMPTRGTHGKDTIGRWHVRLWASGHVADGAEVEAIKCGESLATDDRVLEQEEKEN